MKPLTEAQIKHLIANGEKQASLRGTPQECDFHPVVKLFTPDGSATWLLTEIDPEDHTVAWGLCDLGMSFPEFGTVSLTELTEVRGRLGLTVERDLYWTAKGPISAYIELANFKGTIMKLPVRGADLVRVKGGEDLK